MFFPSLSTAAASRNVCMMHDLSSHVHSSGTLDQTNKQPRPTFQPLPLPFPPCLPLEKKKEKEEWFIMFFSFPQGCFCCSKHMDDARTLFKCSQSLNPRFKQTNKQTNSLNPPFNPCHSHFHWACLQRRGRRRRSGSSCFFLPLALLLLLLLLGMYA